MYENSMKRLKMLVCTLFFLCAGVPLSGQEKSRDKNQLLQTLTSVHVRVFSQDNLLLTPVDVKEKAAWGEILEEIKKFVAANDPSLMNDFMAINEMNIRLLTLLDALYQQIVAGQGTSQDLKNKVDVTKINFSDIITRVEKHLASPQARLALIQQNLDKTLKAYRKSLFTRKEKGDACDLVIAFALGVDTAMQKVTNDIGTLLGKKLTQIASQLFSSENIVFTKMTSREKRTWESLLEELYAYVAYQDKAVLGDYNVLATASSQVITVLQHLSAKLEKGLPLAPDRKERIQNFNADKVNVTDITSSLREELTSYMHQVSQVRQSLEQNVAKFTKDATDSTKAATKLLVTFATTLDNVIQQIVNEVAGLFPKFAFAVRHM